MVAIDRQRWRWSHDDRFQRSANRIVGPDELVLTISPKILNALTPNPTATCGGIKGVNPQMACFIGLTFPLGAL